MKIFNRFNIRHITVLAFFLLFPALCFAQESVAQLDLEHHFVGYLALLITVLAYIIAMTEDLHQMSKAKPMVLGAGLIWFAIFIYFYLIHSSSKVVAAGFESNLMAYVELFLIIMV